MILTLHTNQVLNILPTDLKEFCNKHRIRKLSLFSSALRGELRADSDIDILVEFQSGQEPGLIDLAGMEFELMEHFDREVEMRTAEDLSRYFRDEVAASVEVLYEE
ncbi:MAG: nucleotidyltransferase [Candidatus Omnitrophota bacterium]|jgi:predicted nucleotidyltransferase|nr:MAG: nucleotidyltransferase [Candidatus Omnitrophota bacterium]